REDGSGVMSEPKDPERDGRAGKKPEWDQAKEAELKRQEIERQNKVEAQQKALADMVKDAQKAGKEPMEIEERRKVWEELHRRQLETLAHDQQERADRLELLYRGPPSQRER